MGFTLTAHDRTLFTRREKAQTEGFVQRMQEVLKTSDGYNSQKGFWRLSGGRLCELLAWITQAMKAAGRAVPRLESV